MSFPGPEYKISPEAQQVADIMCELNDGHRVPVILAAYVHRRMEGKEDLADLELICSIRSAMIKAAARIEKQAEDKHEEMMKEGVA